MDADFANKLQQLLDASGGRIWVRSGDRNREEQRTLWVKKLAEYGLPPDTDPDDPRAADARNYVAPPDSSHHVLGYAADLAGDLELAHQLAPRFGLKFPMSWEAWHVEPITAPSSDPKAYTNPPLGFDPVSGNSDTASTRPDLGQVIGSLLGGPSHGDLFSVNSDPIMQAAQSLGQRRPALNPLRSASPAFTTSTGGPDGIDDFMARIRAVESSGNYAAVNTESGANGAYQFMDTTWNGYGGYRRAADAPPEVQDRRARELMQTYYHQFGNWDDVAAAWYSGPGGNFQSGEVRAYVAKVRG